MFNLFRKKEVEQKKLTDFIYSYIVKANHSAPRYKGAYRNLARHIKQFETQTGLILYTNSITESVAEEFISYLKNRNLMLNTVVT